MSTLASNRDVIADILDDLGRAQPVIGIDAHMMRGRLWRGADTLRWCDEFEGVGDCELVDLDIEAAEARADEFEDQVDSIREALAIWEGAGMTAESSEAFRTAARVILQLPELPPKSDVKTA